jgi:hypothetical protein
MNKISVERWNTCATRISLQIELFQEMKNELRIIPMKVFYIESSVQRPKIIFDEENISDAAASPSNDSRSLNCRFIVRVADPA